jgi:hypothetical protein
MNPQQPDAKQEDMKAWCVETWDRYVSPSYHVVIGTRADALAVGKAASATCDGWAIEGPYDFTIAVKP